MYSLAKAREKCDNEYPGLLVFKHKVSKFLNTWTTVFFKVGHEERFSNFEKLPIFYNVKHSFLHAIVEADFEKPLDIFERHFGSSKRL